MVNRKFSESEVRAYTRNRYEDKVLKTKLQELHEETKSYHDFSAKQRTSLQAENTEICMTSGDSLAPKDSKQTTAEFAISNRFKRHWAYSVMETTYNAKYKEAVISLPKRRYNRARSKSVASYNSGQVMFQNNISARQSPVIYRSKSCIARIKAVAQTENPDASVKLDCSKGKCENYTKPDHDDGNIELFQTLSGETNSLNKNVLGRSYPIIMHVADTLDVKNNVEWLVDDSARLPRGSDGEERMTVGKELQELYNLEKRHDLIMPKVITLPRVYEVEMGASKYKHEKQLHRSRSRVSFSLPTSLQEEKQTNELDKDEANRALNGRFNSDGHVEKKTGLNTTTDSKTEVESVKTSAPQGYEEHKNINLADESEDEIQRISIHKNKRSLSEGTLTVPFPKDSTDEKPEGCRDVYFKGRRLKNYIKPEERYKLDPVIVRRRQLKMDRLAKESVTFLSKVNHENIRVEIAFPRAARNRMLQQLVKDNNSNKNLIPYNPEAEILKTKVEAFMESISNYISKQRCDI